MTHQLDDTVREVSEALERLNNQSEPFIPYYHQEGDLRIVVSHPPKDNET